MLQKSICISKGLLLSLKANFIQETLQMQISGVQQISFALLLLIFNREGSDQVHCNSNLSTGTERFWGPLSGQRG